MPRKTIYHADIEYLQILDENGKLDEDLARDTLTPQQVKSLYEAMLLSREMDDLAYKFQRSGRMGTYPPNEGSEATTLGAASALIKGVDHMQGYYRENAAYYQHGLPMHLMYLHWLGDERGNTIPRELGISPMCIEIGAGTARRRVRLGIQASPREARCALLHGRRRHQHGRFSRRPEFRVGVSSALRLHLREQRLGDFRPFDQAIRLGNIRAKGPGLRHALRAGRRQRYLRGLQGPQTGRRSAREGLGPSFIEAITYRNKDHTTVDDVRRYRPADELEAWLKKDPILRTRKYLEARGLWNAQEQTTPKKRVRAQVQEMIKTALEISPPQNTDVFDYVFAELPCSLRKQREHDAHRFDRSGSGTNWIEKKVTYGWHGRPARAWRHGRDAHAT